jgi:hypothetical protein
MMDTSTPEYRTEQKLTAKQGDILSFIIPRCDEILTFLPKSACLQGEGYRGFAVAFPRSIYSLAGFDGHIAGELVREISEWHRL